jgi:hypothetical protein
MKERHKLARRHAVGQPCGDEAAGRHADIAVQRVQVQALHGLFERAQGADLVDRAQRPAAGQGQPDAGAARVRR